jgi:hypothetical protein
MAFVTLPNQGSTLFPPWPGWSAVLNTALDATTLIIDASGERIALLGRFWSPSGTAKTIDSISVQLGTLVNTNGSTIRVSLQDWSTTLSPGQPDGTQDQFRDHTIVSLTSNTWFTSGLLTNTGLDGGVKRTINHGALIAVVFEFQSFGAGDILRVASVNTPTSTFGPLCALFTAAWAISTALTPNVLFTCSDATFATLMGSNPRVSHPTVNYHLDSTPDEYGIRFTAPFDMQVDGLSVGSFINSVTGDFEIILYQDTTVIEAVPVIADQTSSVGLARLSVIPLTTKRTLIKSTQYIVGLRPTTTNTIPAFLIQTNAAGHLSVWPGGVATELVVRTNQGAWAVDGTPERRFYHLGVSISDIDIPVAGGGGTGRPMISVLC